MTVGCVNRRLVFTFAMKDFSSFGFAALDFSSLTMLAAGTAGASCANGRHVQTAGRIQSVAPATGVPSQRKWSSTLLRRRHCLSFVTPNSATRWREI